MQYQFITRNHNPRLILIYAGWAMDSTPFRRLEMPGYDIMVVWDYRDLTLDWSVTSPYAEICVAAWSLGVYAAAATVSAIAARVTLRLAINGTHTPVHDTEGIPEAIFRGTLDGLDERNLVKFYRRVAGTRRGYESFCADMPQRPLEELREELEAFLPRDFFAPELDTRTDCAIISRDDAIFPAANQWRAWQGVPAAMIDGAHLPDFQSILNRYVRDKELTQHRFASRTSTYNDNAPVQEALVENMRKVIEKFALPALMCRRGSRTLEIGSGTGMLSRLLDQYAGRFGTLEMWDMAAAQPVAGQRRVFRAVDAEIQLMHTPTASFDFIASASTVQWFNSPSRFLEECARILSPGGYLLVGTYAKGNLPEVEAATGYALPLLSTDDWIALASARFSCPEMERYTEVLSFDTAIDAFRHLRATGVNSLGRRAGAMHMRRALEALPEALDGRYTLTYTPVYFLLQKK